MSVVVAARVAAAGVAADVGFITSAAAEHMHVRGGPFFWLVSARGAVSCCCDSSREGVLLEKIRVDSGREQMLVPKNGQRPRILDSAAGRCATASRTGVVKSLGPLPLTHPPSGNVPGALASKPAGNRERRTLRPTPTDGAKKPARAALAPTPSCSPWRRNSKPAREGQPVVGVESTTDASAALTRHHRRQVAPATRAPHN